MSSISDALKRAEQERERLRAAGGPVEASGGAAEAAEPSLASVVLRKNAAGVEKEASVAGASPEAAHGPITPLSDALKQSPAAAMTAPAVVARRQAVETIVEDYASKRKLNLPAAMVVYHERSGAVAAQYRRMRDQLMADNSRREPRLLVMTSAVPGEGKTTTLMNLGLSLVELRVNRVLLVDGCLRPAERAERAERSGRPSLTQHLRLQTELGLADLLGAPEREAASFIKATPWHHLFVLPAGVRTTGAAAMEMLKSEELRKRLRQLRTSFDWVLVDAPAALDVPDAGLLGGGSDGIILAAALHHTPREKIQSAIRRFKSMNLPVASCVLTRG